ncbi:hypothetical protein BG006_002320, partial [Podila minutissima]
KQHARQEPCHRRLPRLRRHGRGCRQHLLPGPLHHQRRYLYHWRQRVQRRRALQLLCLHLHPEQVPVAPVPHRLDPRPRFPGHLVGFGLQDSARSRQARCGGL